jgi:hypothetical protein
MYASTSRADADFTNRQTCDPESENPTVTLAADKLAEEATCTREGVHRADQHTPENPSVLCQEAFMRDFDSCRRFFVEKNWRWVVKAISSVPRLLFTRERLLLLI